MDVYVGPPAYHGNPVVWREGGLEQLDRDASVERCGFDGQNGYYNCR